MFRFAGLGKQAYYLWVFGYIVKLPYERDVDSL